MPKKTINIQQQICDAALKLASKKPWLSLTLEQIAQTAKIPHAKILKLFSSTHDLLPVLVQRFDDDVARSVGKSSQSGSAHDRIFDVMMTRFDLLQHHRIAILNIMAASKRTPALARLLLAAQWRAMSRMLEIAELSEDKGHQPFAIAGLLAIYGLTLCIWERDQSKDMAKTMAKLDQFLRFAGKFADILLRNKT